jgi:DNA-binding NarL/FixJ family response regulator
MPKSIRVALFTDSRARAQSIAEMLEEDDRLDVVTWHDFPPPQVDVILAVEIPAARLPEDGPPVVVLGAGADSITLNETVRAALPPNISDAEIVAALVAAALNLTVLTTPQAQRMLRTYALDHPQPAMVESLTRREMEVLQMLAAGLGNKQIAVSLSMSAHTAKFHVAQIMAKLAATSRTEAVSIGIRRGLIPI